MRFLRGILIVLFLLAVPTAVQAADAACTCFCGTAKLGAVQQPNRSAHSNDCIESCTDQKMEVVGCYTSEEQYPEHSEICWTEEQCEDGLQVGSAAIFGSEWMGDTPHCDDRKEPMGYCYAAPRSITTMIAISGDNTFSGLADYINTIYRWLVPTMAVVAIVMVMIAGLQYILSRGNPSAVKQAKERIAKAVVGMILLLTAYTLAYLLDPRLIEFTELRIPKVKQVVLLSPGNKCETLALAGMEIDHVAPASFVDKTCSYEEGGVKGVVTDLSNVNDNVDIGAWKEGDFCDYGACETGATCLSTGCYACANTAATGVLASVDATDVSESGVNALPSATDVYASPSNCSMLSDESGGVAADKDYCIYTSGGMGEGGPTSSTPISSFFPVSCMGVPIECAAVRSTAIELIAANADGCSVYGRQEGKITAMLAETLTFVDYTVDDVLLNDYVEVDAGVLKTICNDDPCGIGALQEATCAFAAVEDGGSCVGL